MKREKRYVYPYKYVKYLYTNDNLNDDDILSIVNKNIGNNNYLIEIYCENAIICSYNDSGDTMEYLKGLGKIVVIADIASIVPSGSVFDIDDSSACYGLSKVRTLNNDLIIFGGYENWSVMINIDSMAKDVVKDKIIKELLSYRENFGFADFKKMYIRMHESIAAHLNTEIYNKPYIYIYR